MAAKTNMRAHRRRLRRSAAAVALCLVAAIASVGPATAATLPAAAPPHGVDDSYYITSSNPQLIFDMGCQDGKVDARPTAPPSG